MTFISKPLANLRTSTLAWVVLALSLCAGVVSAQTLEVKENQWVILKMPSGPAKIINAKQVEIKELVVVTMDVEGKRSAWQRSLVLHMVEAFDENAGNRSEEEIQALVSVYEKIIAEAPDAKPVLTGEIQKARAIIEQAKAKQQEKEANRTQALQSATKEIFEESKEYTEDELGLVIEPALQAARDFPELDGQIQTYLKPWLERQEYLKEGRKLYQGQWMTPAEILEVQEERAAQEQEKNFKENAKLNISSLVLPQASVLVTLGIALITLISVLYSFYHLATARGGNLSFSGAIMLLLGLAILGAYAYYGFRMINFTTDLTEYWPDAFDAGVPADQVENPLPRMLYMASGSTNRKIKAEDTKVVLKDTQINLLARQYFKLVPPGEIQVFDVERLQLVVRLHADRIEFIDEVTCAGKKMLIRYEMFYRITPDTFTIDKQKVFVGDAELPSSMSSYMFRRFYVQLQECIKETNLAQIYSIEKIEPGQVGLIWPVAVSKPGKATGSPGVTPDTSSASPPVNEPEKAAGSEPAL